MRSTSIICILLFVVLGCASSDPANLKQEYEKPVSKSEFPELANQTLDSFFDESVSINYFFEVDDVEESFEAKLFFNEEQYSIEFTTDGEIEDIEKIVSFESLGYALQGALTMFFSEEFSTYSINKIQVQYTSSVADEIFLAQVLNQNTDTITQRYEIEIEGKNDQELGYFEFLFTSNGELLQKRRMYKRSFDNVW